MLRPLMLAAAALALTSAAQGQSSSDSGLSRPPVAAEALPQHLTVRGVERDFLLLDARRGKAPTPLVIALHGGGGNGATMVPRWRDLAEREGLVTVFPEGVGRTARMGTWNAEGCCGYAMTENSADIAFVAAIIDRMIASGTVDADRVYVTGMSNGGMMTHRIAIALSDRIAAAAVVAGAMFGGEAMPKRPVPMLIMHGVRDQIVGYDGGTSPMALVARSQSRPFLPVRSAVDFWAGADGCTAKSTQSGDGDEEITIETHSGCRGGSEVIFYRLKSATHMWPGAPNRMQMLETTPYTALDATETIWSFFKHHARN